MVTRLRLRAAARRRQLADEPEAAIDDEVLAALTAEIARGEALVDARAAVSPPAFTPLLRLATAFFLTTTEVRVLTLLVGLELELSLRAELRRLGGDPSRPAPDVGLIAEVAYTTDDELARIPHELGADGTLVRFALIELERLTDAAFVLRHARAAERVVELAHGKDVLDRRLALAASLVTARTADELVLDRAQLDEMIGLVRAAVTRSRRGEAHPVLLVTGAEGSGRKARIAAAAAACGLAVLSVRAAALPRDLASLRGLGPVLVREAVLARAMIVIERIDDRGADPDAPALDDALCGAIPVPLAATCGRLTGKPPPLARGSVVIEVAMPDEAAREELWRRALPATVDAALPRWAAERYAITPGVLGAAAGVAITRAAPDGRAVTADDVHDGVRTTLDAKLATLGTRITWRQTWSELVLPADAVLEVRELIARVRHRRQVFEQWGFRRKLAKGLGVSALFAGPPGTGKTMVAGLIASELGLDLYQVDLSKIVSKWIGETEKNLSELFDAAEAGHVVLLFDEADSLFAKRTEVKTSSDRNANLEVNYLLQRMESFAGIVILTTNLDAAIDDAFRRRLSLRVEFPVPDPDERARLWRALLPAIAQVADDLDFDALGARFEMTGGYIRNAALRAAFLAADEGTAIAMRHLVRAARAEYQAMGKVMPG